MVLDHLILCMVLCVVTIRVAGMSHPGRHKNNLFHLIRFSKAHSDLYVHMWQC